jgi:putative membrane protein
MKIVIKWLLIALGVYLASYLLDGIEVDSFSVALIVGIVLGLINLIIKPVLKILTLPITIITLGLFSFILNAFLFYLAAVIVDGFEVNSFIYALVGSILVSFFVSLGEAIFGLED